ncbi:GNAT family N-acetyltransferase [Streptomyces sp. NPDC052496]|uniref:GNAT family N-acetyltransferase n=1 Tax=Streptomyces sp. NPDC052496 TaxID=3154951 RepID=UPI00342A4A15
MAKVVEPAESRLLPQVRDLWQTLSASPVTFPPPGSPPAVAVSPDSALCPPSWVGIVALGSSSAIVTAPDPATAHTVRTALSTVPAHALTCPEALRAVLPAADVLGPATLAYATEDTFRPVPDGGGVRRLPAGHAAVAALLRAAGRTDAEESGLAEITSPAFVVRTDAKEPCAAYDPAVPDDAYAPNDAPGNSLDTPITAAAGYRRWPCGVAHLCVLTAPGRRGQGLARRVASAATAHALAAGLLPQWRARPPASRRVARVLGFREVGSQLSVRPAAGRAPGPP